MVVALRHGCFRRLALLYTGENLVGWFTSIALMVLVYEATGSTFAAAAMLICRQVAPGLIVAAAGEHLDRWSVRTCVAGGFLVQAGALALLALTGYGPQLFVLAVISGAMAAIGRASLRAAVQRTLSADEFRGGNAVLNLIVGIAAPVGPALAAYTVAAAGTQAALAVAAGVTALLAARASSLVLVRPTGAAAAPTAVEVEPEAVRRAPSPALPSTVLVALVALMTCLLTMDEPTLLAYATDALGAGVSGYGAIFAAWGVGLAAGGLIFAKLLQLPMVRVYSAAMVLVGLAYIGLGVAPSLAVACVVAVGGGIANGFGWVAVSTALQEATAPGEEARTASRLEAVTLVGPGVGYLLGSGVAELFDPRMALVVPGVATLLVLIAGVALTARRRAAAGGRASIFIPSIQGGSA